MNNIFEIEITPSIVLENITGNYIRIKFSDFVQFEELMTWEKIKVIDIKTEKNCTNLNETCYILFQRLPNRELLDLLEMAKERLTIGL
jgi:hypothetical protein